MVSDEKIRFQLPSSQNYFCEMKRIETGYELIFYQAITRIKTIHITEAQIDRQFLHKVAVNVGIDFYALTGPYDCADEILRQWHKHFKKKRWIDRIFGR